MTAARWGGLLFGMGRAAVAVSDLVGRDTEVEALDGAVAAACAGRLQVVFVEGPAGIGKSRLLAETISHARRAGMDIVSGRDLNCIAGEESLPLNPGAA